MKMPALPFFSCVRLGFALGLSAFSAKAHAQFVSCQVTGTVTHVTDLNGDLPSGVTVGDQVLTTFSFRTPHLTNFDPYAQITNYSFAASEFSISTTIGALTWSSAGNVGSITIRNDGSNILGDVSDEFFVISNITGTPDSFPGALESYSNMGFDLRDTVATYDLITGFALPTSDGVVNLGAATLAQGFVQSSAGASVHWNITYSVESLTLTAIPEPATVATWTAAGAFAAVIVFRARRQQKGAAS